MSDAPADISHDLYAVRLKKLQDMRAAGFDPYRASFQPKQTTAQARAAFVEGVEPGPAVAVAGRILVLRDMGKSSFAKIQDQAGILQIYFKIDAVGEERYREFKKLDLGDVIGVEGTLFKTKTGEVTVRAQRYELVSKSLRPLPEKWHGLTDSEQIYRQRYLDLIINLDSRQRFLLRSRIVSSLRRFLEERGFMEVETPILQAVPGGAAAKPFQTHHNALGCDFFLRISLELYLKRLLVAGFDRVFEIGRNFRNEGISRRHNPEFTMLEVYQAYSDYRGMMSLIRDLIQTLCRDVLGGFEVKGLNGEVIRFDGEWREVKYKDLLREETGDSDWFSRSKEEKLSRAQALGLTVDAGLEDFEITQEIFSKRVEPKLIQPTFVTHLPKELCPLAKISSDDPTTLDVFELCISGMEIAPAYSEQNDPFVQREMFQAQAGEEIQSVDTDFLTSLEYGMPPAGGMGVGIDRLVALLTGAENLRDVILFPQLRPQTEAGRVNPGGEGPSDI